VDEDWYFDRYLDVRAAKLSGTSSHLRTISGCPATSKGAFRDRCRSMRTSTSARILIWGESSSPRTSTACGVISRHADISRTCGVAEHLRKLNAGVLRQMPNWLHDRRTANVRAQFPAQPQLLREVSDQQLSGDPRFAAPGRKRPCSHRLGKLHRFCRHADAVGRATRTDARTIHCSVRCAS